jgi:hypothetical protein
MADTEYIKKLFTALKAKADWLDKNEIPKLKEGLGAYRTSFALLYNLYIKNGLIKEDPYKNETKTEEIEVPNAAPFKDEEKLDQMTQRLSNYDNQLDSLVNVCKITPDYLTLDRIKRITGLIRYIDWVNFTGETGGLVTAAVVKMTNVIMTGNDAMTLKIATDALANMKKYFTTIMAALKLVTDYQRESYKLDLRDVTDQVTSNDWSPANQAANVNLIKAKLAQLKPEAHFYPELAEEVIHEDHYKDGPDLKNKVLKKLEVAAPKPKAAQATVKTSLLEGLQILGNMTKLFTHVADVMDGNQVVLDNRKKTFIQKLKEIFGKGQDAVIYEVKYMDPVRGVPVYEKVNFTSFRDDLDKLIHRLTPLQPHGSGMVKLEAMQEDQLFALLERDMREINSLHKILTAMDEYFKANVDPKDRDKIRGIRADLETIKSSISRANAKRHDYEDKKESEHQNHPPAASAPPAAHQA